MLTLAVTAGVGVLASLALAVQAAWRVAHGRFPEENAWMCVYAQPVLRASQTATWCANVGLAVATLRTVRGQAMAPRAQVVMRAVAALVGVVTLVRHELMVRTYVRTYVRLTSGVFRVIPVHGRVLTAPHRSQPKQNRPRGSRCGGSSA